MLVVGGRVCMVGSLGWSRGGTSGRFGLLDGGVRLIFEGWGVATCTSRPCIRRGSLSGSGRGQRVLVAHSRQREPRATVLSLPGCSCSPRQHPGTIVIDGSVKGGGLPEKRGELTGDSDCDHTGGLAALVVQVLPALVQPSLRAPRDRDHPGILSGLSARERLGDRGCLAGRGTTSARCPCGSFSDAALPNPA